MKRLTPKKLNTRPKKINATMKLKNAIKHTKKSRKKQAGKSEHLKRGQKNLPVGKQQNSTNTKTQSPMNENELPLDFDGESRGSGMDSGEN